MKIAIDLYGAMKNQPKLELTFSELTNYSE